MKFFIFKLFIFRTSLLRSVQREMRDIKEEVMVKSEEHERMISSLKNQKQVAEDTIRVIDQTEWKLKNLNVQF